VFDNTLEYGILGMARSGIAAARLIKDLGGKVFLSELRGGDQVKDAGELQQQFDCEFGGHTDRLYHCDRWIVSPGIPLDSPIILAGKKRNIPMISEIELGYQVKAQDSKIIAVTGSNGKSTVASLIDHLLKNNGYRSILAGNIGAAFCSFPIHKPGYDFIVLEISSFQLDLIDTFRPNVAVLLNITPDHMNRYAGFNDYINSKFRIFENQRPEDTAVICLDSEPVAERQNRIPARLRRYSLHLKAPDCDAWMQEGEIRLGIRHRLPVKDLKIMGPHNHANVMAALLAADALTNDMANLIDAARAFMPLTHRLEFVADINGVLFFNDSKATNTDSVRSALLSFDKPIRIIMGGSDKGEDFSVLTELLKQKTKKVYVTGDTAPQMEKIWKDQMDLEHVPDFEDCIRKAWQDSQTGDIVVLSPACASFDRFRNFEHRGDVFKSIVEKMANEV